MNLICIKTGALLEPPLPWSLNLSPEYLLCCILLVKAALETKSLYWITTKMSEEL